MDLADLLEMWFGPLDAPHDEARCLFLGAGFTKACNRDAPLFGDYVEPLREGLRVPNSQPAGSRLSAMSVEIAGQTAD